MILFGRKPQIVLAILFGVLVASCATGTSSKRSPAGQPVYCIFETPRRHSSVSIPSQASTPDRLRWIADHLGKVHGLTRKSLADFDRRLKKGQTLEEIRSGTDVYARLWALRQFKESFLETLVSDYESRSNVLPGLESSNESPALVESKLTQEFSFFLNLMAGELKFQDYSDSDIQKVLADVKVVFEDKQHEVLSCQQDRKIRGFHWVSEPVSHAEALALPSIDIEKTIRQETRKIKRDWSRLSRRPFQEEKIRPDIGPAGNVSGNQFPKGTWALTFDDGPARTTIPVLDALQKYEIQATFFVLSGRIQNGAYLDIAERILKDGHDIGSHSFTHPEIPKLTPEQREHEIKGAVDVLKAQLKVSPVVFRLPYGSGVNHGVVRQMIKEQGLIHVFWNVDTLDWADKNPQSILERTKLQMDQVQGGIILFHDIHLQSVDASTELMRQFYDSKDAVRLVTVPQAITELNQN